MKRRTFLKIGALTATTMMVQPRWLWAINNNVAWDKTVVMVELKGGNDGLNSVIPFADSAYYSLRPELAVEATEVLPLDDTRGLHPQLEPLINRWNQGDMAIIEGLGYEDPNLSHFRSIDIWDSASLSSEFISDGWIGRLFAEQTPPETLFAEGIAIASNELGPLAGSDRNVLSLSSPEDFLAKARATPHLDLITGNPSLDHIIGVQNEVSQAVDKLAEALAQGNPLTTEFPTTGLGRDLGYVAQMLACGLQVPAFKVSLGSFDTHSNQKNSHENLLAELALGLDLFCQALQEAGVWDKVLICTYSEFGRRAAENGSAGTDHGTAAPHFILGGQVQGGIYGTPPSLTDLDENGNLRYTVDFHSLYRTLAEKWWGISVPFLDSSYPLLNFL